MEINENIELKRIFDIIKNKKTLIGIILVLFIIFGFLYSYCYVVPEYKSTTTLLIIPNSNDEDRTITTSDLTLNSGLISTYSNIAKNSKVLKQVISNLQLDMTESQLLSSIQVNILKNTHIIEITVINKDPEKAKNITKEIANVFLTEIKEIYNLENIGIIDEAQLPNRPYNINHIKDILMFLMIGVVLTTGYIVVLYLFDNTVKNEDDVNKYIKIKALGYIPIDNNKSEIVDRSNSKSYVAECINTIRTNILYMNSTKNAKTILVTSCTPKEGKSWTSANIAVAFAETNKKVLLIDSDMRKGRANKIFNVKKADGLSNYLYFITGDEKKDLKLGKKYIKETEIPNLHILTNGTIPPNPSELLGSNEMKQLLELLKNAYDMIIIDAPPCKLVSDSIVLSTIADSTILVANSEKTKISDLIEAKKSIEIVDGKIIGAIINKVKIASREYGNSYYYGHNTAENEKYEVQETKKITVNEVIEDAIENMKQEKIKRIDETKITKENQITIEDINADNKENIEIEENNEKISYDDLERIITNQNEYLKNLGETISDVKIRVNNSALENKLKEQKENKEKEELKTYIDKKLEEINENDKSEEVKEYIDKKIKQMQEDNSRNEEIKEYFDKKIEEINENDKSEEVKEYIDKRIEDIQKDNTKNDEIKEYIGQKLEELKANNEENLYTEISNISKKVESYDNAERINNIFDEINSIKTNYSQLTEQIENVKNTENEEKTENIENTILAIKTKLDESIEKSKLKEIKDKEKEEQLRETQEERENKLNEYISQKIEELQLNNKETLVAEIDNIKEDIEIYSHTEDINNILKEVNDIKEKIHTDDSKKMDNIFEQISSINEMITNLKDSYLELSNIIKSNDTINEEIQPENNYSEVIDNNDYNDDNEENKSNIIDIKLFNRLKYRKQEFSFEEDIYYEDLEKTAMYVIPIPEVKNEEDVSRKYESFI